MPLRSVIRIAADRRNASVVVDSITGQRPNQWRGNDLAIQIGLFSAGQLDDVTPITSLTLQVKALGANGSAPSPAAAALMQGVASDLNEALTVEEWLDGSDQHVTFEFSSAESNIPEGTHWIVLSAATAEVQEVTYLAGLFQVNEDGFGLITDPAEIDNYINLVMADARYIRQSDPQTTTLDILTITGSPIAALDADYVRAGDHDSRPRHRAADGSDKKVQWDDGEAQWQVLLGNQVLIYSEQDVATADLVTEWVTNSMLLEGSGDENNIDGLYLLASINEGKSFYSINGLPVPSNERAIQWSSGSWRIINDSHNARYSSSEDVATPDLVGVWDLEDGVAPPPTVASVPTPTTSFALARKAVSIRFSRLPVALAVDDDDESTLRLAEVLVDAEIEHDDDLEILIDTDTLASGREAIIRFTNTSTTDPINLTWPAGLNWLGSKLESLPAEAVALITLKSYGTTAADIFAAYQVVAD